MGMVILPCKDIERLDNVCNTTNIVLGTYWVLSKCYYYFCCYYYYLEAERRQSIEKRRAGERKAQDRSRNRHYMMAKKERQRINNPQADTKTTVMGTH